MRCACHRQGASRSGRLGRAAPRLPRLLPSGTAAAALRPPRPCRPLATPAAPPSTPLRQLRRRPSLSAFHAECLSAFHAGCNQAPAVGRVRFGFAKMRPRSACFRRFPASLTLKVYKSELLKFAAFTLGELLKLAALTSPLRSPSARSPSALRLDGSQIFCTFAP